MKKKTKSNLENMHKKCTYICVKITITPKFTYFLSVNSTSLTSFETYLDNQLNSRLHNVEPISKVSIFNTNIYYPFEYCILWLNYIDNIVICV